MGRNIKALITFISSLKVCNILYFCRTYSANTSKTLALYKSCRPTYLLTYLLTYNYLQKNSTG